MTVRRIACGQVRARDLDDAAGALEDALAMVADAGRAKADICVLPEGTYPAYVLGSVEAARAALAGGPNPLDVFGAAAREAGNELIVGLVLDSPAGLLNAAVHFDRTGVVLGHAAKQFLWHFDHAWFAPGEPAVVHHQIGALVCADGRLPEIAHGLVQRGATLLVNATAWVTALPAPEGTNPQAAFLWRVRALEHGVAAAAATKVGTEAGTTMYSGRSQIVAADGTVVAEASATEPELLVADVEVPAVASPPFAHDVALPTAPVRPHFRPGTAHVVVITDASMLHALRGHDARVVVGPNGVVNADDVEVVELHGDAMLVPGPARAAAFTGVELIAWIAAGVSSPYVEAVARARAMENRVFVAVWRARADGGPLVVDPSGRVLARAPADAEHFAIGAPCLLADAATKQMAPGTDAWDGVLALGLR
jgi:predicted amidohydrolase